MTPFFFGSSCLGINGLSKYHDLGAISWTTVVLAVVALLLMLNGARWLLQESPPAANELLVATCVLDAVADDARLRVCTETRASER
jgi:hypothetical protein